MKKGIITLCMMAVSFLAIGQASAQSTGEQIRQQARQDFRGTDEGYRWGVSLNLGPDMGIGGKWFFSQRSAIEGQFAYNIPDHGIMASAVYEYHMRLARGFNLYAGAGVNIGVLNLDGDHDTDFAIGIAPIVGVEYKFARAPIALAVDYKPNLNFTTDIQWQLFALKVRWTF